MSELTFALVLAVLAFSPDNPEGVTSRSIVASGLTETECHELRKELAQSLGASSARLSNGSRVLLSTECEAVE